MGKRQSVEFLFEAVKKDPSRFQPVRLPDIKNTKLENLTGGAIDKLEAKISATLKAKSVSLPITQENQLNIKVLKDTTMSLDIVSNKESNEENSIIQNLEIGFSKPLILDDIIPALAGLPSLFEDTNIKSLKSFLENIGGSSLVDQFSTFGDSLQSKIESGFAFLGKFEKNIKQNLTLFNSTFQINPLAPVEEDRKNDKSIPLIYLTGIHGVPKKTSNAWELELSFTGQVIYMDQPLSSFKKIKLPKLVIPRIHAELEKFLTKEPLSSAEVQHNNLLISDVLDSFNQLLNTFKMNFSLSTRVPEALSRFILPSQSRLSLKYLLRDEVEIQGSTSGKYEAGNLSFLTDEIIIKNSQTKIKSTASGKFLQKQKKSILPALLDYNDGKTWKETGLEFDMQIRVLPGSYTGNSDIGLSYHHPLLKGYSKLILDISEFYFQGNIRIHEGNKRDLQFSDLDLNCHGQVDLKKRSCWNDGKSRIFPTWNGNIQLASIKRRSDGPLAFSINGEGPTSIKALIRHEDFPEISVNKGIFQTNFEGLMQFGVNANIVFNNSGFQSLSLENCAGTVLSEKTNLIFDKFKVVLPKNFQIDFGINKGKLDLTGKGGMDMFAKFDPGNGNVLLEKEDTFMSLFYKPLVKEELSMKLITGGQIKIKQTEYNSRAFQLLSTIFGNELDLDEIESFIEDQAEWRHITRLAKFLSANILDTIVFVRRVLLSFRKAAKKEKIEELSQVFPPENMKRLLFAALDPGEAQRKNLYKLINNLINAKKFDTKLGWEVIKEVKLPDTRIIQKKGILNLFEVLFSPILYNPHEDSPKKEPPFSKQKKYSLFTKAVPSAHEIYQKTESVTVDLTFENKLIYFAHYLRIEQLRWILKNNKSFGKETKANLTFLLRLKERIHITKESFGSVAYLTQGLYLNFFLSEVTQIIESIPESPLKDLNPLIEPGYLSPEDIAILLQASLSAPISDRTVQLNQHRIFSFLFKKSPDFLFQVLIEMGDGTPRILANILYSILECDLNLIKDPLSTRKLLEEKIGGLPPLRNTYLNNSSKEKDSYIYELILFAEKIIKQGNPYIALKYHLHSFRHPEPNKKVSQNEVHNKIKKMIESADAEGANLDFFKANKPEIKSLTNSYTAIIKEIRQLISREPEHVQVKIIKDFMQRNYEALQVYSIVENYKKNTDKVRDWLHKKSLKKSFSYDQEIVDEVINVTYLSAADRRKIKKDPLVRCLLKPDKGNYNFTVISCMGIVTGGKSGTELSEAYRRLKSERGIPVIRADTGVMRSLKANSLWVTKALEKAKTPFGFLGYSQGCANSLTTESFLRSGTPDEQKLISGLVSRNLLFSAANGSVHGSSGDKKLVRFLKQFDIELRSYQNQISANALKLLIQSASMLLSSKFLVHLTGGINSIKRGSNHLLGQEGQFCPVPTLTLRGVVTEDNLPDSLRVLCNMLTVQSGSELHDTQVSQSDQQGFLVSNENIYSGVLKKMEISGSVQKIHHWSPLKKEVSDLITKKDTENCVFDSPKDRHIFPWIDLNIRFGLIKKKKT
jgi:hypothetical protein